MNNKLLYGLAGVAILVIVVVLLLYPPPQGQPTEVASTTSTGSVTPPPPAANPSKPAVQAPLSQTNTFTAIFNQPGAHECEYNQVTGNAQNNYRIYIAGGKMRGEFRTVGQAGTLMVYDGNLLYTWKEGQTTGIKAQLKSLSQLPVAIPTDLTSGSVYNGNSNTANKNDLSVSWDCHPWIVDKTLLTVPSYVHFISG